MKKFEMKTTNYKLLIWTITFLLVWLGLSLYYHDFDKFKTMFMYAIAPSTFFIFFGDSDNKN